MVRVLHWNGKDVPEELKELPAGEYVLESVDQSQELTPEEDAALRDALAAARAGAGVPMDEIRSRIETRFRR